MKSKSAGRIIITAGTTAVLGLVLSAQQTMAVPQGIDLGSAGPGNWTVLEIGTGDLDIEVNAGGPVNGVSGNVGLNGTGALKLTGTTFVNGNVVLSTSGSVAESGDGIGGGVHITGTTTVNQALLDQARADALSASSQAKLLASSGGGVGITSITSAGTLSPGVYNLTSFELGNGEFLHLGATGGAGNGYVFNISGSLKINGPAAVILDGVSTADVLFNITGTTSVAFSGGSYPDGSEKAVLSGIILAPVAGVNLAPGQVFGEIISGQKISIVSGSDVTGGTPTVPDAGSTMLLMSIGVGCLAAVKRKFVS